MKINTRFSFLKLKDGQATLSLVFLIGGATILIGSTLAFIMLSFLNSSLGFQSANRALAIASGGVDDAMMRLARNVYFEDTDSYCVPDETQPCSSGSATVTVTQDSPSSDLITITSEGGSGFSRRKIEAVVAFSPERGETEIISWEVKDL